MGQRVGTSRRLDTPGNRRVSAKAERFVESVIREMTRVAQEHEAINLAQGFPDFPCPPALKQAAIDAIQADVNQYAVTWGAPDLRQAIGEFMAARRGVVIDPDAQVTVCCGATEGMISAMMGVLDPGDEVIIPEPFYENYGPDCVLSGAVPRYVSLGRDYGLDPDAIRAAIGPKTRGLVLCTPHNPTGRVFQEEEIAPLCELCREHDLLLFTDEIYEEILYTGPHRTPLLNEGMAERTLLVSGASKTFSVTGWRVGWVISPPELTSGVRKVHDFLTVGAPAPLQAAVAQALRWSDDYFSQLVSDYRKRRDRMVAGLQSVGFDCRPPEGSYYVMADCRAHLRPGESDTEFALRLIREAGVATVPGSSFYADPTGGRTIIRFCYAKRMETIEAAVQRLQIWSQGT